MNELLQTVQFTKDLSKIAALVSWESPGTASFLAVLRVREGEPTKELYSCLI